MHSLKDLIPDIPLISEAILYPNSRNKKEGYAALLRLKEAIVYHVQESQKTEDQSSSLQQFEAEANKIYKQVHQARQLFCR